MGKPGGVRKAPAILKHPRPHPPPIYTPQSKGGGIRPPPKHGTQTLRNDRLTTFLLQQAINAEKQAREETEEAMLRMLEDVVTRLQEEVAIEKRDRQATEETLLKLLEDTCLKMNDMNQLGAMEAVAPAPPP